MVYLEKFAFWVPGIHFLYNLISKGQTVMERPSERDTHVDGTLGGGGSATQGHQGPAGVPDDALGLGPEDSPEDLEREMMSLKQECLQCEGSCRSHMNSTPWGSFVQIRAPPYPQGQPTGRLLLKSDVACFCPLSCLYKWHLA